MRSASVDLPDWQAVVAVRTVRTWEETRRGEPILADVLFSGELRENTFRAAVGDPAVVVERTDVFFLIDKGSMLEGAPLVECFGVMSVLPVG
jgi:hypothetical protein